VQFTETTRR